MIKLHFCIARTQWFITKYSDLFQKRKSINSKKSSIANIKNYYISFSIFQIHWLIYSQVPKDMEAWWQSWLNSEKSPMLIKTFKILQTLCAVYGWEVVNNHVFGRSMDNPVTQASLPAERFDLRHPCHTQGRELAAIIGTTNEKPFTNIIPKQRTILY